MLVITFVHLQKWTVIQFKPYHGAKIGNQIASQRRWGYEEKNVLDFTEFLPQWVSYHIYMDTYITSFFFTNTSW